MVPLLGVALGHPVKDTISAVMAAYIGTGLVQTSMWAYKGSLAGRDAAVLCLASMPTAVLAGFLLPGTPAPLLTLLTALLASASGLESLAKAWRQRVRAPARDLSVRLISPADDSGGVSEHQPASEAATEATSETLTCQFQVVLGSFVGFGSAVTGTGGPFLVLPLLLICRPVRFPTDFHCFTTVFPADLDLF